MSPQSKDETPTPRCDAPTPITDELFGKMPYNLAEMPWVKSAYHSHRQLERALLAAERDAARLREALEKLNDKFTSMIRTNSRDTGDWTDDAFTCKTIAIAALAGKQEEGR